MRLRQRARIDERLYEHDTTTPAARLAAAVLHRALADLSSPKLAHANTTQEALAWIMKPSDEIYNCEDLCEALNLPIEQIRELATRILAGQTKEIRFNSGIRGLRRDGLTWDKRSKQYKDTVRRAQSSSVSQAHPPSLEGEE